MKNKSFIVWNAAVLAFGIALVFLPCRHYRVVGLFGGVSEDMTDSIYLHLREALKGDYIDLAFLVVFFPLVIIAELHLLRRNPRFRWFLPLQGVLLLCAMFEMGLSMNFSLLETDLRLSAVYYAALVWVGISALVTFLLISKRLQNAVRGLLETHA